MVLGWCWSSVACYWRYNEMAAIFIDIGAREADIFNITIMTF